MTAALRLLPMRDDAVRPPDPSACSHRRVQPIGATRRVRGAPDGSSDAGAHYRQTGVCRACGAAVFRCYTRPDGPGGAATPAPWVAVAEPDASRRRLPQPRDADPRHRRRTG